MAWTRRSRNLLIAAGFPASLALAALLSAAAGGAERLAAWSPLRCPFHALTGWLCPTCGLTRSVLLAWTGEWGAAWRLHFLGPVLLVVTALAWLTWILWPSFRLQAPRILPGLGMPKLPLWIALGLYVAWGFSRNFSG